MNIKIIIDNKKEKGLESEWGLCVYIDDGEKKYLLDTGASNKYLTNLNRLGIKVEDIDYAFLSHSHIDHSGGYKSFFENNQKAKLYLGKNCTSDCYTKIGFLKFNIGMPKYIKEEYSDRLVYTEGLTKIRENVYFMEHTKYDVTNKRLFKLENGKLVLDNFLHESNLIFDTPKGLVVLNSCSHLGLDNIINEVNKAFPNKKVYMLIGGLHLVDKSTSYDVALAGRVKEYDIDYIYTGHCTKERGYKVLRRELGEKVVQIKSGMEINI